MEETGEGAQLTNLDYSPIPKNPITLALMFQMFLLDAFIYFLIAIYIENVFPGKFQACTIFLNGVTSFFSVHFFLRRP